jgi:signal transduction histidine kinase
VVESATFERLWEPAQMDRTTHGILEIARSVLAELELDVVLERVLAAAQELTDARYAAIGVLDEPRTQLARFLTRGIDEQARAAIGSLPRGRGVLGVLISDAKPLRLADVGAHPGSYGFPHGHPPMRTFLGVPIVVGGEPFGDLYLTEKAGGAEFSEADEEAVAVLAEFAGVAIDHARRYTGAREHHDELTRTVAALEATTQIARAVGGETDPEVVLELVAKRGRALVSARSLLIELRRGDELHVAAGAGELPPGVIGAAFPIAGTVAEEALRTRRLQRLEDETNRSRYQEHGVGARGLKATNGIVVPLVYRGETHGVLLAVDRLEGRASFTADDEMLLESFATSAATAVATARSVTAERHRQRLAAAEAERQRWARELHDDTLQSLSALRIGLAAARRSADPERVAVALERAIEQLEDAIANLRALITDLRPAALDELGAKAALEALADRISRRGIEVDVSVELRDGRAGTGARLDSEVEVALYRIVQEALTNAVKHGHATRAAVEVDESPTAVRLSVRDDGMGFDPEQHTEGFGLLGMRERVSLLEGELEIESSARGTTLIVRIPIGRT